MFVQFALSCSAFCILDMGYLVTMHSLDTGTLEKLSETYTWLLLDTGYTLQDLQYRRMADLAIKQA